MSSELNNTQVKTLTLDEYKSHYEEYKSKVDALRKSGTDQIKILENENRKIKGNRLMEAEVKQELIEKNKEKILAAKEVAKENSGELKNIVSEATKFLKQNYKPIHKAISEECKALKEEENNVYKAKVAEINNNYKASMAEIEALKTENREEYTVKAKLAKQGYKQAIFEAKTAHNSKLQEIKDKKHDSFKRPYSYCSKIRDGHSSVDEKIITKFESYLYNFDFKQFLFKNGLYIIIIIFMIGCIIRTPSLIGIDSLNLILKNFSTKVFFALGVAGLILLAGTDLSVGRMVTLSTMITCMILNPNTTVKFFGVSFNNIYKTGGFGLAVFVALLFSIFACTLFSVIAGFFTSKFKIHPFISTLGTSLVIWGMIGFGTNNIKTGTISNQALSIGKSIGKTATLPGIPLTLIYAIVAIIIVWFIWNKTKFGKNMYAVGGNPEAASVSGISVFWTTMGVFIMAGILYGLGGFFQSTVTGSSSSSFGQGWELEAIAACVIGGISFTGGIGKISGAVFGCLLFEILKYYLRDITGGSADISNVFIGVIILLAVTLDSLKYLKKK